ncbi:MAG: glycosyltransferase family 39 protein [Candidatus Coatesbacteria bacterium]|nr:MAG: glycosyltransferase family 39 protein [Candidatus Coatesbacteria bacterium]
MRRYGWAIVAVALAGGLFVLNAVTPHIYKNTVGSLLAKAWHLALFAALWLAAYFVGRAFFRLLRLPREVPPEVATAAGVVAFSVAAFALAAAHLAYAVVAKVVVVAVLVAGAYPWFTRLRAEPGRLRRWLTELEPGPAAWLFAAGLLTFPLALAAAEPPIYWDALTYHLAVPFKYLGAHHFAYLPHNIYASMPLGATMFYLWAMMWDGLTCANASYFVVTLLAAAVVYRLARRWLPQFYAATATFLVYFTPVFFVVMPGAHVDHFLMLYVAAALFLYFTPRGAEAPADLRRAAAVGVFLGAALAVKYTSIYALGAFVPLLAYDLIRRRLRARELALILAVAFLFVVPWLVKAYVERGNPVFPLFYDVLGGRDFTPAQAEALIEWQHGMCAGRGWSDYLLLPYRISVEADFDYKAFAGVYLPFLLPLAAVAAVAFRRAGRIVVFGWGFFVCWSLGPQQLRFLDGGLAALAVAAAGTLAAAEGAWGAWGRATWRAAIVAVFIFSGVAYNIGGLVHTLEGFDYLAGQSREGFLDEKCAFYRAQMYLNEDTPPDARVLMMFTNHTLYLEREAVYDSFFEASAFLLAAEEGADAEGLYRLAREWGVTHVHLFHMYEERAWASYSVRTKNAFFDFLARYTRPAYKDPANDIYELRVSD